MELKFLGHLRELTGARRIKDNLKGPHQIW
jgi:hypothetical protein